MDNLLTAARNVVLWDSKLDEFRVSGNRSAADMDRKARLEILLRNAMGDLRAAVTKAGG